MKKQPFFLLAHIGMETSHIAHAIAREIGKEIVIIDINKPTNQIKEEMQKERVFIIKKSLVAEELRTLSYRGEYSARTERRYKERKSKKQKIR